MWRGRSLPYPSLAHHTLPTSPQPTHQVKKRSKVPRDTYLHGWLQVKGLHVVSEHRHHPSAPRVRRYELQQGHQCGKCSHLDLTGILNEAGQGVNRVGASLTALPAYELQSQVLTMCYSSTPLAVPCRPVHLGLLVLEQLEQL